MRWTLRIAAVVALAWAAFNVSPYLALYDLARTVERRDEAAIEARAHVSFIRASLTRQIVAAYLEAFGGGRELDPSFRRLAAEAAPGVVEPMIGTLVTGGGLIGLLENGSRESVTAAGEPAGAGLSRASLQNPWRVFSTSQFRGFRTALFFFPLDRPPSERFRLRLRLSHWTWRLIDVDLPPALLRRLVQDLPRVRSFSDRTLMGESSIGLRLRLEDD